MPFHILPQESLTNRREFMGGLIALGAAASLGAADNQPGYLALLSDTHIAADPKKLSRQQNMAKNLSTAVEQVLGQKHAPAGVFIDGDLALLDGQLGDYQTFLTLIEPLRKAKLPIHLALGNHDDRSKFRSTLKGTLPVESRVEEKHVSVIDTLGLRLIVLDSLDVVNVTIGVLGKLQTEWLGKELDAHPETPTIILLHHNVKASSNSGLSDDQPFLDLITPRKQVKGVVFGHTHVWDVRRNDAGLYLINLPATGYPFAATQPIGWTKLTPKTGGGTLELVGIGGNPDKHGEKVALTWR